MKNRTNLAFPFLLVVVGALVAAGVVAKITVTSQRAVQVDGSGASGAGRSGVNASDA